MDERPTDQRLAELKGIIDYLGSKGNLTPQEVYDYYGAAILIANENLHRIHDRLATAERTIQGLQREIKELRSRLGD